MLNSGRGLSRKSYNFRIDLKEFELDNKCNGV